jgi:AmmeMemoRadiSam system protein B/AmmeMemoRadiSam system protein A
MFAASFPQTARRPAVAGVFYPARSTELRAQVRTLLQAARAALPARPKALIVPHAGYAYSGATAAAAYASLAPWASGIERVVLIGPAHRVAVRGIAVPGSASFATPLGEVPVDTAALRRLDELDAVRASDLAHAGEHSLEVQLPFLQSVLPPFRLVPLLVGLAEASEVAEALECVWGGDETLIVASSDLSHYLPEDAARHADAITVGALLHLDAALSPEQACGAAPLNGLLLAARRHGLQAQLLAQTTSGASGGRRDSVVGYAALALLPAARATDADDSPAGRARTLTGIARRAIGAALRKDPAPDLPAAPWLQAPAACFVSLHTPSGALRGCIGALEARRPLGQEVASQAVAAARCDPRFAAVDPDELPDLRITVSVLGPAQPLELADEAALLAALRPGIDGLTLVAGERRATFLPQVWQTLPEPRAFLAELKAKAGLPHDAAHAALRYERYTTQTFEEAP